MSLKKSLLLIGIFIIIGNSASADVYRSEIITRDFISNRLEFSVEPNYLDLISVEIINRLYPVDILASGHYIAIGPDKIDVGSKIVFYYHAPSDSNFSTITWRLYDGSKAASIYSTPHLTIDLIPLLDVTDTLSSGIAGEPDTHKVGFNIWTNQIEEKGQIWISFNTSFDAGSINTDSIKYSDDDGANDGDEPTVDSVDVIAHTVIIRLDSGIPAAPNSRINIELGPVTNTIAGNYIITVQTLDSTGTMVHTPTASEAFAIEPNVLSSVTVSPAGNITMPSDSIIIFTAAGHDTYGNTIGGLSFSWASTVDSCGWIDGGAFRAKKRGQCYVTATSAGLADSSGLITVVAGDLDRFGLTGYPTSITAGSAFPGQIVVTAYDVNSNRIYDFADSIYFYSDDDSASFTYDEDNLYTFQAADSGRVSLAGANFVLKKSGSKTISVTNGSDTTTSSGITVQAASINAYSFSALGSQTAGVAFNLTVTSATDQYGNAASGIVIVDDMPGGGGNSPYGVPPIFSNITVTNGTGFSQQILTNAVPTVLKGEVNAIVELTDTITVQPGIVGYFILTNYPDTITAGQSFPSPAKNPIVTVRDLYGNISTNYNSTVYFSGAESLPAPYTFVPATDHGVHSFSGNNFIFETAGFRKFQVYNVDASLADTSSAIEVYAAAIDSFTLSNPGAAMAGVAFSLSVSGAVDEFGNAASGTIIVADSSGAGNAPDGSPPSLNNIAVANGSGNAQQTLVKTGSVILKATGGAYIDATNAFTVQPGAPGGLAVTNCPASITAGHTFPSPANDPVVTASDLFGNLATNYTGTITFSGPETVPGPYTFVLGDAGQKSFSGDNFAFETSGWQNVTVTDAANSLTGVSSPINVLSNDIASFTISAPANVTAGVSFTAIITNALDQYGNNASGVITVSLIGNSISPNGDSPVINNITISDGTGSASQMLVRTGVVKLTGTFGSHADTTNNITAAPGTPGAVNLGNYPGSITAGQTFPSPANDPIITVYDIFGNLATNYTGTITFSGPETIPGPYTFIVGDAGQKSFSGTNFAFETAGLRTLTITDAANSLTDSSTPIQVNAAAISSFTLSEPGTVTAGMPFTLSIADAKDLYDNNASGTATITIVGGSISPNGDLPVINNIAVNNGAGSANQTLVLTGIVRLAGAAASIVDTTANITVIPGEPGALILSNYPDTIFAGQSFPSPANDPVVRANDIFGNLATNYTGIITFSGPETVPGPDTFEVADAGQKSYSGDDFIFENEGWRNLVVTDTDNGLVDTSQAILVLNMTIVSFAIAAPANVTAGVPFDASVSAAQDQYGNSASGVVNITVLGNTVSPNGDMPTISNIVVNDGSGRAGQILVLTGTVKLIGTLGAFADTTNDITIGPGALGGLELGNCPDSLIAGETFPSPANNPIVTIEDLFGNRSTNYAGTVTFSSADSVPGPYTFLPGDSGQKEFSGDSFLFRIAGLRKLIATDIANSLTDTSSLIYVFADEIDSFALSDPGTVTAGVSFNLAVSGAVDQFGNSASGIVAIDSVGQNNSPNGSVPTFNDITVENGSGGASQILVRTGSTRIRGGYGSFSDTTAVISVLPGSLGALNVVVASPQISGVPFVGPSIITARDGFGNVKTNFDASADTIVITASSGGPLANNVLNQNSDFASGVADLGVLGVTYNGRGGSVTFTAASESGIQGVSNAVQVRSITAAELVLSPSQVIRGDSARGTLRITNLGNVAVNITDIDIFTAGQQFAPVFTPSLPEQIPGGADSTFNFSFLTGVLEPGDHSISFRATGEYSGTPTSDSLIDADIMTIVTESDIVYNGGTLSPSVVSRGESYSFAMGVHNDGGAALNLADSSYLYFTDGPNEYTANLSQNSFVGPGADADLIFVSELVPTAFTAGLRFVEFFIFGSNLAGTVIDSISLADSVLIQTASNITHNTGTLSPDILLTGAEVAFSVEVNNSGQATLLLDHNQTRLIFGDGVRQYIAPIDTSAGVRVDSIPTGNATLTFIPTVLVPEFIADTNYIPLVNITGTQNQRSYTTIISTDSILVLQPGQVRLDSLTMVSYNVPKVNVNQEFTIHGYVSNLGNEPVDSVRLILTTDGYSIFNDTLEVGSVDNAEGVSFDYAVTADSVPNLLEAFYCTIDKAINRLSGDDAPIATPLDNSTVAIIEAEANLWIDTLYLSDDSLSTNQEFTVYTNVRHQGSSSYTGSDQLIIDFGGDVGFVVEDSLKRDFIADQPLSWNVTAPGTERPLTSLTISFFEPFIDLNDSSTALGADSSLAYDIVVTNRAHISHRASITAPIGALDSVLSTGQLVIVTDSLFPTGNIEASYARLILPSGFTSSGPLTRLLVGDNIEWQVRAGESEVIDSLGFNCWSFDSNTGDSVSDATIWIPIQTISRATLSINSSISFPPSAIDRVVSPGGFFTLDAMVTNIGDAETSTGELTLTFENNGFAVDEPLIRTFNSNELIQWHVTAPDIQILDGTTIYVLMSTVPSDLNSNEQAVVLSDSAGFDVILKEELPKLVMRNPTPLQGAAVAGQSVDVYRFYLENSTELTSDQVALISFGFRLMSNDNRLNPGDIISSSILYVNDEPYAATLGDSAVSFVFDPSILIEPDSLAEFTISITPVENPPVDVFNLHFASDDIVAQVVIGGIAEQYVEVVLPDGEEFSLESMQLASMTADFSGSVKVSQNPYLASEGNLLIGYNLETEATIDFTIYNVYGDIVWEYQANAANGQGTAGQHFDNTAAIWDGTNSSGDKVLSGIYYIIANNITAGQTVKMKVAVIW